MSLTIIVPTIGNKELVRKIKRYARNDDEVITFTSNSSKLRDHLNGAIKKAKHKDVLIVNPSDSYSNKQRFLNLFRGDDDVIITYADQLVQARTSIKINKNSFEPITEECTKLKEYIQYLYVRYLPEEEENATRLALGIPKKEEKELEEEIDVLIPPKNNKKPRPKIKKITNKNATRKIRTKERNIVRPIKEGKNMSKKPKVVFLCDVKGWAWWIKSNYIKRYLESYYDIDIFHVLDGPSVKHKLTEYDLCFTYGYFFVTKLGKVNIARRLTGLTAHRPRGLVEKKMKMAGNVHANSVLLYKELKRMHDSVFYVPNGVDTGLFYEKTPLLNKDKMVFGHVGKRSPMKCQATIIEPAIKKSKVEYFSHYNNHKSRLPHEKMVKVHQNYDVFICASKEDGTPCPALEAAACGRPIISNRIGNMPELIDDSCGILLDKKDVDLYVDAIKGCEKNPEKIIEMGKNIRKKIENEGTWELMSKNYLYLFDQILGIKREGECYENPAFYHIGEN